MKRVLIAAGLLVAMGCGGAKGRGLEVQNAQEDALKFTQGSWQITNYAYVREENKLQIFLKSGEQSKELVVYENHARFDLYQELTKPDAGTEVVFRYNGEGYIQTPASKLHKQDPTNPSSFLFPISTQRQRQAQAKAQEMTKYAWTIVEFKDDDLSAGFNATLTLTRQGGEKVILHVAPDHLAWYRYTELRRLKPGSTIRFEYRPAGYNEADLSRPEQDGKPEYYLAPVVNTQSAHDTNDRVLHGRGRFLFLFLTSINMGSKLDFVIHY
jgi:hypothetical protein